MPDNRYILSTKIYLCKYIIFTSFSYLFLFYLYLSGSITATPSFLLLFLWYCILRSVSYTFESTVTPLDHVRRCRCCSVASCIRLFVTPWTVVCQAPLSMAFPRQEYWHGLPFLYRMLIFLSPSPLCLFLFLWIWINFGVISLLQTTLLSPTFFALLLSNMFLYFIRISSTVF